MKVKISGTILLDNKPLKRNFIDLRVNLPAINDPLNNLSRVVEFMLTDDKGHFSTVIRIPRFIQNFDITQITIGIHAHNSAIRVLNAIGAFIDIKILKVLDMRNGGILNLTTSNLGNVYDHFRILAQSIDIYDTVWKQFKPYNRSNRRDFPLKRSASIRTTFANSNFAQVAYPSLNPGFTWTEPADVGNRNLPLVHLSDSAVDYRLFGINGSLPTLMPHELGHVYHFAGLKENDRFSIEAIYGVNLILDSRHNINIKTTQFVAFIEAIGHFSRRFYFFAKLVEPSLTGVQLRQAFWRDELSTQTLSGYLGNEYENVGTLNGNTLTSSLNTGKDVEGRVYGAIFLHLAKIIGLSSVIGLVFGSRATTFDEFKSYINSQGNPRFINAINTVENTWF